MNIRVFLIDQVNPEEFRQRNVGQEEYISCDFINGWVVISDRWGGKIAYPFYTVRRVETSVTHEDRGS